ncbi:UbiA family prenyltransferase [Streptomyces sp. NPDC050997]|uniref:UbiA family prenyltransferase n=1 Tax=Streptomyces sp. NPDC050997 TaxID=3155519 RepID=UPI00343BC69C
MGPPLTARAHRTGRPTAGRALLLLLRSCSVRFTAYYWVGFAVGLAACGRLGVGLALLGVPMWLAYCLGTESVNRIADRAADEVNRPERTRLCEEFGWSRLTAVAVLSWGVFVLIGAALTWWHPGLGLPALLLVDIGVAIGYSIGPAFKRHRVLSLLALTAPLITPLLTGWAVYGGRDVLLSPVLPAVSVLAAFSLGLSGIKDITDVEGDRRLGYSSLWLALARIGRGAAVYAFIGAPFLLLALYVALGHLPASALASLPLVVVSVLVVAAASRAHAAPDREAAREVMHQYTFYFLALCLLACAPTRATAVAVTAGVAYWLVASKALHWSGGLTLTQLRRWVRLLIPASTVKEHS